MRVFVSQNQSYYRSHEALVAIKRLPKVVVINRASPKFSQNVYWILSPEGLHIQLEQINPPQKYVIIHLVSFRLKCSQS